MPRSFHQCRVFRLKAWATYAAVSWTLHAGATEDFAFFEHEVRPLLISRCYECHSEAKGQRKGGLWLDRREGWALGGDAGPAVVPGDPAASLLMESVHYGNEDLQMPPKSRLSEPEVAVLERWVRMGAPDPRNEVMVGAVRKEPINYEEARLEWAYGPLRGGASGDVPGVIDDHIADRLSLSGLTSTARAEPGELLRRVHYALTGLPPTREEMASFQADSSEAAYAAIVDDLLSRSSFGETWGRHWLDVARYADSNGGDRNYTYYQAWRYRNWVIDAVNADLPYGEFVRAQLAGDLLAAKGLESGALTEAAARDYLVASTFVSLGPKMLTERDKEKLAMDAVDEQIDTLGQAFLGLTIGCARCHDHKFDPISQEDYYALAGIFRSTEVVGGTRNGCVNVASWVERPMPGSDREDPELSAKVERLERVMRLTVEQSFKKKIGAKMVAGELPLRGLVYDDPISVREGVWTESSHSPRRIGTGYWHNDRKGDAETRVTFVAALPESGVYEVRLAYSAEDNRAKSVPVTLRSREGDHVFSLDQTKNPKVAGVLEPLGQFSFEKGVDYRLTISTEGTTGAYVVVDAVQFIPVVDIAGEAAALAGMGDPLAQMSEGDLKKELERLIEELKNADLAMAPRDEATPSDVHLRVRGEVGQLGPLVARGFPEVFATDADTTIPAGSSGRVELANWMVGPAQPLLHRVIVNRVWHHLLGRGIIPSVDNFGRLGEAATHPALLDALAVEFGAKGGSIKALVRGIVLSETYRRSCDATPELRAQDPGNLYFGYQNRRRLSAEEIRDSLLLLSGEIDLSPAQATATPLGIDLDDPISVTEDRRRSVYLPVARNNPIAELAVFDMANPDYVSGLRQETTVPTQALYLLNSQALQTRSAKIGELAMSAARLPGEEVGWLYQTLLGRAPNPVESERARGLMADLSGGSEDPVALAVACGQLAHVLLASAEFLYLD